MQTLRSMLGVAILAAGLLSVCGQDAAAQRSRRGSASQAIKKIQRDIAEVQKQLPKALEELGPALKTLGQAQTQFRQAQAEIERARKTLHERVGPKVGLPEALAQSQQARKDYDKAVSTLTRDLHGDEDFQQLEQKHKEAEENLNALRKEKSAGGVDRKSKLAALTKAAHQARDAYQARIDRDPKVKPAYDVWMKADARLAEVRKRLSQETKDDSEVQSAESSFKQAKSALEKAQFAAAGAEGKVAALRERLATDFALLGN